MKKMSISLVPLWFLLAFGCSSDKSMNPAFPVSFQFNLLNENREATKSFTVGKDITFSFVIVNASGEAINLNNFQPDLLCQTSSDFFRVYHNASESGAWADLGRPCIPSNCSYEGAYQIEANAVRKIEYLWFTGCAKNAPLQTGKYKTGFEYEFSVNGGKYNGLKSKQVFSINFEVK